MLVNERPFLQTVVSLEGRNWDTLRYYRAAGFLCYAPNSRKPSRGRLFLVTNVHLLTQDFDRLDVIFRARDGANTVEYSVTSRADADPDTWFTDRRYDLAVLPLDLQGPSPEGIRYRSFDLDADTLTIPDLRKRGISEGAAGLLIGFGSAREDPHADTPLVRSAIVAGIPRRAKPNRIFLMEGIGFCGNSGSPIILKPGSSTRGVLDGEGMGMLIGVASHGGSPATIVRADEERIEAHEGIGILQVVPVDVLRRLIRRASRSIDLAETFGPVVRRVRGWLRRRRQPT